jgi:glucan phosphorylase
MSLINEGGQRYVRMANLACVGSHAINGVAALHTELLRQDVLRDMHALDPDKISNKTNGVTPRRWMALANPRLSSLLYTVIGEGWVCDLEELRKLEPLTQDAAFRREWRFVKRAVKEDFAAFLRRRTGVVVDPRSLFDVQVKRIHEYKRQHLNLLHIIALYLWGFRVVSTRRGAKPRQTRSAAISGNLACAYAPEGWLGCAVMARTRLGSGIARDLKVCRTGCETSFIRKKLCVGV